MKAIVQERYGSPDVLSLREVPPPRPAADEVLVEVRAASVNARDWHVMRGDPYLARLADPVHFGRRGPRFPIRGTDFAGRVAAVGAAVTGFRVGQEVYGDTVVGGAFAEYVSVSSRTLAAKPAALTFAQAAAVPLAASTALLGLRDAGELRAGQRVLVNGASGGVGTFAVQIARALGADVTAVCSTRNVELIRSLGVDRVVDYTREDFARTGLPRHDVVLDLVGNRSLADLRRVLMPSGTLVLSGGGVSTGGSLLGPLGLFVRAEVVRRFVGHRIVRLDVPADAANLATLGELADGGALTPVIDRSYPLARTADAIRYVETEHARAKVVITVA
ncbi:NAD(P)-dependent alcohol dehydrogenase [Micromonospora sp. DT233]|uniref:NAD(P)-dependent alcohol dehydrogenase n=1 Tax=Micromonospora sp. DT233 TaxID=3393432 RepID=UPI003CEDD3A9